MIYNALFAQKFRIELFLAIVFEYFRRKDKNLFETISDLKN